MTNGNCAVKLQEDDVKTINRTEINPQVIHSWLATKQRQEIIDGDGDYIGGVCFTG